ncbi:hypothetical protein LTR05_007905 [Lithohypha guttulata]|uniref:Peptidyl-prolyl cis-trans isomerase n=1 Tax=Lithohypha guttulata TaxID=1690604 RepID=A0AAN7SUF5_9EURO|nr:hypothetical protein LTR05_007905 [Lithohypha guttulata]
MNKLKSLFKHDKEDTHSSTNASSASTGIASSHDNQRLASSNQPASYDNQAASHGSYSTPSSQQPISSSNQPGYSGGQQGYAGGQQGYSGGQQLPTDSSFPDNNAPSTGAEYADNAQGVVMHTTLGDITIALFSQQTPKTCKNFATLAATGKYDGVIFHRIIPGFMIQGGDPDGTGRGGRSIFGGKFEDEFVSELRHTGKGILSMANSGPNTNGSQFFICLAATPHLDGKHTVFGQVADGLDVVDALGAVRTGAQDRPVQEVKILRCDVF